MEDQGNTLGVSDVLETGDVGQVRMILGDRARVPYVGIIRPGIKVPLARCTAEEKQIYEEGMKAGLSFDEIDQKMGGEPPKKSKLLMSNCDYYRADPGDFRNPRDADVLHERYDDPDGKLRRLPIWFRKGEIDLCIPHNFRGYLGRTGYVRFISYWEGDRLLCRHLPEAWVKKAREDGFVAPKRADYQTRPCPAMDNPEKCPDLNSEPKRCAFGGLIRCCIPGVSGIGEVIVPTSTWFGLGESIGVLQAVQEIHGRIHGLFQGKPFLELIKVHQEVPAGGKRQMQWLVTIQPSVPMEELAAASEPVAVAQRAQVALSILQGARVQPQREDEGTQSSALDDLDRAHEAAMAEADRVAPERGEIDPEVEKAIAEVKAWWTGEKVGRKWDVLEAWIRHEWSVKSPDLLTKDQAQAMKAKIREGWAQDNREGFLTTIADVHRSVQDELPFA